MHCPLCAQPGGMPPGGYMVRVRAEAFLRPASRSDAMPFHTFVLIPLRTAVIDTPHHERETPEYTTFHLVLSSYARSDSRGRPSLHGLGSVSPR